MQYAGQEQAGDRQRIRGRVAGSSGPVKPGELPVMQAAKFEFVLNLEIARALGIDVPMAFSAAAYETIE